MKRNNNTSLPYPVYGLDGDYKGSLPKAYIKPDATSNDQVHKIIYTITDTDSKAAQFLFKLVKERKASLNVEIDCGDTFLREIREIDLAVKFYSELEIEVELYKLNYAGSVSISCFITAIDEFELSCDQFDDIYEGATFTVTPGDVLAVYPQAIVNLELDWEHMLNNAGAPVKIVEDKSDKAVRHTLITGNYIEIYLPSKDYNEYKQNFENVALVKDVFLMCYMLPALITALYEIMNNPTIVESCLWAQAIRQRIDSESIFEQYRPMDGIWSIENLQIWKDDVSKIASLIMSGGDKSMMQAMRQIAKSIN